jgi:hypothetical protein
MLKKIAKFIDFDLARMGAGPAIEEFNHKYAGSWCLVNKQPTFINKLKPDVHGNIRLIVSNLDGTTITLDKIDSIDTLAPKTGLYANKDSLIYLYRIPNRQWTKGLAFGANYSYKRLLGARNLSDINAVKLVTDPDISYAKESLIIDDRVYLHWKQVGTFNEESQKIHLTNNHFLRELQEIWPQLQITLDAQPHKNVMEERLILDF